MHDMNAEWVNNSNRKITI